MSVVTAPERHGVPALFRGLAEWADRMVLAARFALVRPDLWPTALAGFLARGGALVLLLPIVVLPSPVAIGTAVGVDAVTIAGQPTTWLIEVVSVAIVILIAWITVAGLFGAAVDGALVQVAADETASPGAETAPPHARGGFTDLVTLAAIQGICLLPVAAAIGWLGVVVGITAVDELRLPTSLAGSIYDRVIARSAPAIAITVVIWIVFEVVRAVVTRRRVLAGDDAGAIWWRAIHQVIRRPITTVLTGATAFAVSVVAIGLPLAGAVVAFEWCRVAARGTMSGQPPLILLLAVVALVVAWLAALLMAAITSLWRSAAFTLDAVGAGRPKGT